MTVTPYVNFDGRCEEAINFYKKALGAEVEMMMRYKDHPAPDDNCKVPPGAENKIMHASLRIGDSVVMASDCHIQNQPKFQGISLSLGPRNDVEAAKVFAALSEGGQVCVPLNKTFFASSFGVVTDRFGLNWMIAVIKM